MTIAPTSEDAMSDVKIDYKIWSRFHPNHFLVAGDVLGLGNSLSYKGWNIEIRVPGPDAYKESDPDAKITSYQKSGRIGEELKPTFYIVQCLYVLVDEKKCIRLDARVRETNANCYEFIVEEKQKQLNEIADAGMVIAEEVYDLFSRAARWVTDDATVCRPHLGGERWGPRILDKETERTVWIGGKRIASFGGEPVVNLERWRKIVEILSSDSGIPVYIDLYNDARYHLCTGELNRCVSDCAVSCETFIRRKIASSLPKALDESYVELIDEYNIRPILNKVLPKIVSDAEKKILSMIQSDLNKLFDCRNSLFHSGCVDGLTEQQCREFLSVNGKLLALSPNTT